MSSTNKTSNLRLNSWIGSDKPQRTDFNYDNEIIDREFASHTGDTVHHIDDSERQRWNSYIHSGTYFGDGATSRIINTRCPFEASFGVVFAGDRPSSILKTSTLQKVNYIGFFSVDAHTSGVFLQNDQINLRVDNNPQALMEKEYMNFNELGVTYHYVMFR